MKCFASWILLCCYILFYCWVSLVYLPHMFVCFVVFGLTFCRISSNWWLLLFIHKSKDIQNITESFIPLIKANDYKNICFSHTWLPKTTKYCYINRLHQKITSKDNYLNLHQRLEHGSPITTSLVFGRGGFDLLVLGGGLGIDDCGLSGVAGGLFCGSSSSDDVQRKRETSSLGDGGWIGIQGFGSSDDSDEDGDLGGITPLPLDELGVWLRFKRSLNTGRSCFLFLACSFVLHPLWGGGNGGTYGGSGVSSSDEESEEMLMISGVDFILIAIWFSGLMFLEDIRVCVCWIRERLVPFYSDQRVYRALMLRIFWLFDQDFILTSQFCYLPNHSAASCFTLLLVLLTSRLCCYGWKCEGGCVTSQNKFKT